MTKKEMLAIIKDAPDDTEIFYNDMNFTGVDSPVEDWWLKYNKEENIIVVNSIPWEPCD